jgi:hypothetical protein
MSTSVTATQRLFMVRKLHSIARNNLTLMYPDEKDAKAVIQRKANDVDQAKHSSSPKLISPDGGVSFFLVERISTNRRSSIGQIRYTRGEGTTQPRIRHRRLMGLRIWYCCLSMGRWWRSKTTGAGPRYMMVSGTCRHSVCARNRLPRLTCTPCESSGAS